MKLILASSAITTAEIASAVLDLVGKPTDKIKVAIINEGYVANAPGFNQKWLIDELFLITKYITGTIVFVNLRVYEMNEVIERLKPVDLIYIVGGAQIILPKLFKETGFNDILVELAQTKVIIGTSAGANVLGKQIEDSNYWEDQYGSSEEYLENPSLNLVDFNILPHFRREDHPKRTEERLTPLLKNNGFPLYAIKDTQAVVFNDGKVSFIGGDPVKFGGTIRDSN